MPTALLFESLSYHIEKFILEHKGDVSLPLQYRHCVFREKAEELVIYFGHDLVKYVRVNQNQLFGTIFLFKLSQDECEYSHW